MSYNWPWYTEWNGIFMPVEDALGMGCISAILMMPVILVSMILYGLEQITWQTENQKHRSTCSTRDESERGGSALE